MYRIPFLAIVLFSLLTACQNGEATDASLEEAGRIHLEAVELNKDVHPKIDAAIERKNQLMVQGRELTEAEQQFIQQVENIENSYAYWEENHVEVPGFEHDDHDHDHHDHEGHDHDHSHAAPLDVTPADMLIIQQEFRDTLLSIQARLERLDI